MISKNIHQIIESLREETGASIGFKLTKPGKRSLLEIWFEDISKKNGPIFSLVPYGLKKNKITIEYGTFSNQILNQMKNASEEKKILAEALVNSLLISNTILIKKKLINAWSISLISDSISIITDAREFRTDEGKLINTCQNVIAPLMGAFAELIGYNYLYEDNSVLSPEGSEVIVTSKRRERNPRSRLLCLKIHGEICKVCNVDLKRLYNSSRVIIEIHHIEPLSELSVPRVYNPITDLIPLCPNCHAAVHSEFPALDIETLKSRLRNE